VIVAKSPIERILAFARERGWGSLRLLSSGGNTYNRDYHGENEQGDQLPMMNVFARRRVTLLSHVGQRRDVLCAPGSGHDARHVDLIWPVEPAGHDTEWTRRGSGDPGSLLTGPDQRQTRDTSASHSEVTSHIRERLRRLRRRGMRLHEEMPPADVPLSHL
jgi:predicted dithiol-disulfide oxidoreductase (DUF899 family)